MNFFPLPFRPITLLLAIAISCVCSSPLHADDAKDLKALAAGSQALFDRVKKAKADDPQLYFLETQTEILNGLSASAYFKKNPADLNWLVRTTRRFMNSLEKAMDGKIAQASGVAAKDAAEWDKVFAGQVGGFWWGSALKDVKELAAGFKPKPMPAPQLDEWYATAFMVAHIDFDLRMALLCEGAGTDTAFDEVGKVVKTAWDKKSRYPRSLMEFGIKFDPALKTLDPMLRRTRMRNEVKAYLASKNVNDPRKGLPLKGTPERGAFGGAVP